MLALTRRVGEEVVIGDPKQPLGVIRVVEIHGDKVRLSFDFPRDTQVNRKELAEQKARQAGGEPPASAAPSSGSPDAGDARSRGSRGQGRPRGGAESNDAARQDARRARARGQGHGGSAA